MDAAKFRRALFAACRAQGLDDDMRHDLIQAVTGKRSSTELTPLERAKVLDHLNRLAARPNQGAPRQWRPGCEALGGKVAALLADQKLPWRYLTHGAAGRPSMLRRLAGVDRLEFAGADGLRALIAALAKRQAKQAPSPAGGAGERDA